MTKAAKPKRSPRRGTWHRADATRAAIQELQQACMTLGIVYVELTKRIEALEQRIGKSRT